MKDPSLTANNHVKWALVASKGNGFKEIWFVDAKTGRVVDYMAVGEGCRQ